MKTCTFNNALYANGRYYVHGFRTEKGFTVIVGKKAQWRRGAGEWISRVACDTYEKAVEQFKTGRAQVDQIVSEKADKRSEKSSKRSLSIAAYKASKAPPWHVGDLCHTSWGYDQTNVDAFQVITIKSRTSIIVRPIGGDVEDTGYMQGKFTPKKNQFTGAPITVRAGFHFYYDGEVSESWAVKGHSLYETKEGQSHHFSSYA